MDDHVLIWEMGPRDGLQNEAAQIPTEQKVALVNKLSATGLRRIEVTSFVSPRWVPQMADAAQVFAAINRRPGVVYSALTPNMQGFEAALSSGVGEVAIFASASEAFSSKNINCSITESMARFQPVLGRAHDMRMPVRAYVSCAIDCPYDGPVVPANVAKVTRQLLDMGCYEVSLADTIGSGQPDRVHSMLDAVLDVAEARTLALHFHDTQGRAIDNVAAGLERGIRIFDAAVGGLGGCPYAPGAKGNVATETVVDWLHSHGLSTGTDLDLLREAGRFANDLRKPT
ncbi:hydroxymethylglutaryl-CoA lyase [Pseudotabrizicola sp. 4114]|uniref:hydroxymethylglutaryl-CoA lyase n=1 Tax=Pseudotabrizicola sp. 4114 TaxID=2817731 RepID=UPI0028548439|nr:hydroxymethylglutaryl-CoA lyase [Pseudorhodobacter sp. 4114]